MLNPRPMRKDELADFLSSGEPSTAEFIKANIQEGFDQSIPGVALDYIKETFSSSTDERATESQGQENIKAFYEGRKPEVVDDSSPQLKTYSKEDWAKSDFRRDGIEFQDGWSEERARFIAEGYDERKERELILSKGNTGIGSTALGFASQMVGGLADPINLIPFGGAASKTAKVGEKLIRGAIEGGVGNLAVSAVARPYWDKRGTDSNWKDYVNDLWMGAGLGGGFAGLGHGVQSRFSKKDIQLKDQTKLAEAGDVAIDAMATGKDLDLSKVSGLKETFDSIYDIPEVQRSRKVQDLTEQLTEMGYSPDDARTHISPIVAQAEAFSRDFNMDIDSFLEQYGPTFQKSEVVDGQIKGTDTRSVEINKLLDSEILTMSQEITFAEKGGARIFNQEGFVGTTGEGSFPSWYKEAGVKNKEHLSKVLKSKKGPVYDRLKAIAEDRLMNGYETPTSRAAPSNDFLSLLGKEQVDIPMGPDGVPLFKKSDGKERGAITFDKDGKAIIHLFEHADESTIIHETGHLFLNNLEKFASIENAPASIRADFDSIKSWMGVKDGGKIQTAHHEKFARGFEQFLRDGKAPRPELQGVFSRFKDWLTAIYKSNSDLKVKLSDDARAVYSRLLGSDSRPRVETVPEVKAPEPRFKDEAEIEAGSSEIDLMVQTNPGIVSPEEAKVFRESILEIEAEEKALDEVATFFQSAKDDKALLEAANKVGMSKTQFERIIDDFNERLMSEDEARLGLEKLIEDRRMTLQAEAKELKRQAYLSLSARIEVGNHVNKILEAGGTLEQSILSLIEGDSRLRGVEGAGKSVDGSYMALAQSTSSKCFSELRKVDPKIEKLFEADVQFNQNVAKEMVTPGSTNDPIARQSAEILSRYSEDLRQRANLAGAKIGKLEGHVPRNHDVEKMVGKETQWVKFMMENHDPERTMRGLDDAAKEQGFREIYASFVSDNHAGKPEIDTTAPLQRVPRNIAKKMGESRSIHFKNAEVEVAYLKEFGQGENILQSMASHYEWMSRRIALMERLGPNPEATIAFHVQKNMDDTKAKILSKEITSEKAEKLLTQMGNVNKLKSRDSKIGQALGMALGEMDSTPGSFKSFSQFVRAWNSFTKLGSALLSQPTDFVHAVNERRILSDRNEAALWVETFKDYFHGSFKDLSPEKQEIMDHLGIFVDSINYKNFNKFDGDNINNKLARANDWMFRWSGQNWHVKHSKQAAGLSLARELGGNISKSWSDMSPGLKETLVQYGSFTEKKWQMLQNAKSLDVNGKAYFHPGLIQEIPDSVFNDLLPENMKGNEAEIKRERFKLEMDLKTFFVEESRNAAPEPDAKVRRQMAFGTKAGTKANEAIKMLTQFKTFAFVNMDRSIMGKRMMKDPNDYGGIVHHAVATLALGYISTILKDTAKGLEPADPTLGATWGRAAMQSGGLGIMGDFFGSAYSARSGSDVLASLAGPTASTISSGAVVALKSLHGETYDDGSKYASKVIDFGRSLAPAPFSSLWYTRAAMDHLVWQNLKETLEPGSIRRSQKRLKKEFNQKYIVNPHSTQWMK